MIHELIPWTELTRTGVPPMKVARRPLTLGEVTLEVGQQLDPELLPLAIRRQRLRQFYEQRRLEPVNPLPSSRQFYRDRLAGTIAPITPVASQVVADLPALDIPVEESEDPPKRRKK